VRLNVSLHTRAFADAAFGCGDGISLAVYLLALRAAALAREQTLRSALRRAHCTLHNVHACALTLRALRRTPRMLLPRLELSDGGPRWYELPF